MAAGTRLPHVAPDEVTSFPSARSGCGEFCPTAFETQSRSSVKTAIHHPFATLEMSEFRGRVKVVLKRFGIFPKGVGQLLASLYGPSKTRCLSRHAASYRRFLNLL